MQNITWALYVGCESLEHALQSPKEPRVIHALVHEAPRDVGDVLCRCLSVIESAGNAIITVVRDTSL